MKTALTALAVIAAATSAMADGEGFAVINKDASSNGQVEIITQTGGEFTLTLVNCLPMRSAVLDTAGNLADLDDDGETAALTEVVRGTVEHDIAAAACA